MTALSQLKRHLRPGQVYRRADLARWSNAVDRHVRQLVEADVLQKVAPGLYACPKKTSFGRVTPEDEKLVQAFLKSGDFLLFSPNAYNALGVGTTQLYNRQVVYNRKRHGQFTLGSRVYDFQIKPYFPKTVSEAFLLVDLVNNLERLAESEQEVLARVKVLAARLDNASLLRAANRYGGVRARKLFHALTEHSLTDAA